MGLCPAVLILVLPSLRLVLHAVAVWNTFGQGNKQARLAADRGVDPNKA